MRGHVQDGRRFAVIVQADDLLALSTVVRQLWLKLLGSAT
jgi:hypothetical protein